MKVFLDWDGTIREGFTVIDWVLYLEKRHLDGQNFTSEEIDRLFVKYNNKEIDHNQLAQLTADKYFSLLKQIDNINLQMVADEFIKEDISKLYYFYEDLFSFFNKYNFEVYVISGAPLEVLKSYKNKFKFKEVYGLNSTLSDKNRNPGYSTVKEIISNSLCMTGKPIISIGNSISDIPILKKAKISILINSNLTKEYDFKVVSANPSNLMSIVNEKFNELYYK